MTDHPKCPTVRQVINNLNIVSYMLFGALLVSWSFLSLFLYSTDKDTTTLLGFAIGSSIIAVGVILFDVWCYMKKFNRSKETLSQTSTSAGAINVKMSDLVGCVDEEKLIKKLGYTDNRLIPRPFTSKVMNNVVAFCVNWQEVKNTDLDANNRKIIIDIFKTHLDISDKSWFWVAARTESYSAFENWLLDQDARNDWITNRTLNDENDRVVFFMPFCFGFLQENAQRLDILFLFDVYDGTLYYESRVRTLEVGDNGACLDTSILLHQPRKVGALTKYEIYATVKTDDYLPWLERYEKNTPEEVMDEKSDTVTQEDNPAMTELDLITSGPKPSDIKIDASKRLPETDDTWDLQFVIGDTIKFKPIPKGFYKVSDGTIIDTDYMYMSDIDDFVMVPKELVGTDLSSYFCVVRSKDVVVTEEPKRNIHLDQSVVVKVSTIHDAINDKLNRHATVKPFCNIFRDVISSYLEKQNLTDEEYIQEFLKYVSPTRYVFPAYNEHYKTQIENFSKMTDFDKAFYEYGALFISFLRTNTKPFIIFQFDVGEIDSVKLICRLHVPLNGEIFSQLYGERVDTLTMTRTDVFMVTESEHIKVAELTKTMQYYKDVVMPAIGTYVANGGRYATPPPDGYTNSYSGGIYPGMIAIFFSDKPYTKPITKDDAAGVKHFFRVFRKKSVKKK